MKGKVQIRLTREARVEARLNYFSFEAHVQWFTVYKNLPKSLICGRKKMTFGKKEFKCKKNEF